MVAPLTLESVIFQFEFVERAINHGNQLRIEGKEDTHTTSTNVNPAGMSGFLTLLTLLADSQTQQNRNPKLEINKKKVEKVHWSTIQTNRNTKQQTRCHLLGIIKS